MMWTARFRCTLICLGFVALFSVFSFRLIYLQITKHQEYSDKAKIGHVINQPIYAERGNIYDAHGEALANNIPKEMVVADASHLTNRNALIEVLGRDLKLPLGELEQKLGTGRRYIVLKREVEKSVTDRLHADLKSKNLNGIYFEHDSTRLYPSGPMLCHVIGFTNFEHEGVAGVEGSMEQYLHGEDGFRYIEHNRAGDEIVVYRGQERAPRDGYDVRLTIDSQLQNIVENEIDAAVKEYHPEMATIILMRPKTGEILAMANRPNFDLNHRNEAQPEQMKNRAVTDMLEPGSTFKIVAVAAALNEHKVQPETTIFCENGVWNYSGTPLHDHRAFGDLTVQDILVKSCNIGAAKLAIGLGENTFYEYIRRFGFGEETGIELPAESHGAIKSPRFWNKTSITRIPMGHEIDVTPLQMAVAMSVIANGGNLVAPRIIQSVTAADGHAISTLQPTVVRRVISAQTASQIGRALRGVVSDRGTAAAAAVPGYVIAGKTGTAEKYNPKGGYEHGKYVVSFCGYIPADDPQMVGLVMLDDAKTDRPELNYGGMVAGPIFSHIAEKAALHLDLERQEEIRKGLPVERVAASNGRHH